MNFAKLPPLFWGAKDYKDDPDALEMAQRTFNEEGLYEALAGFAEVWHKKAGRPARIIDLCAATGLCSLRVSRAVPVAVATLVDSDRNALERAVKQMSHVLTEARPEDASGFSYRSRFDLVLANSAYHHISDDRKVDFLKTARELVDDDGAILVGDHFLPSYNNVPEFKHSVEQFYEQLVRELENRGEPPEAIDVIRRSALYCWLGEYEFKVSWSVFLDHCAAAGLSVKWVRRIWEPEGQGTVDVGTRAIWLRPRERVSVGVFGAG